MVAGNAREGSACYIMAGRMWCSALAGEEGLGSRITTAVGWYVTASQLDEV